MRCFLSIDVEDSLKTKIIEMQDMIKQTGLNVKLVEPQNLHFTINFLRDVNKDEIENVKNSLGFLRYEPVFKINVNGMGYFGHKGQVRTLWLGVNKGEDGVIRLLKMVNDAVKFGEKNYSPHLTIARAKNIKNATRIYQWF